jgi:arabinan endo-1,5-alpha-L-arabinosidase
MREWTLLLLCVSLSFGCATPSARTAPEKPLPVPVLALNEDFPDPTVIRASDGWYYGYATQTIVEQPSVHVLNIQVARSKDLVSWELLGDALPVKPSWAQTTQKFWAPHVIEASGRYYLYYSADPDTRDGLCLAVATADSPAGPFTDSGRPMRCNTGFSEIDPMAYDDPRTGKRLLYWGSGFEPLRVQELAPDRVSFMPGTQPIELVHPKKGGDATDYMTLLEGSWVLERNGTYYLFFSGNNCCEPNPHYAVMVARSSSATGPFELYGPATGRESNVILESFGGFIAPGHNSVVRGPDGKDRLLYHAIDSSQMALKHSIEGDRRVRRVMLSSPLEFVDGWPVVRTGLPGVEPSQPREEGPR